MSLTSSELKQAFLSGKNSNEDKGAGPSGNVAGSSSIPEQESAKRQSVTSQNVALQVVSTCRCETRCCNLCVSTRAKCIILWVLVIIGLILCFLFGGLFYFASKLDANTSSLMAQKSEIDGLKEAINKLTKKD
ncbi:unnamed protein product [Meloidogyne enterolobii]|uniref:Uncharacterized protein n=1 Tax=Meloidogyne enterolobii TaxID=390850 RepID=A0ACB1AXX8_MELEN